MVQTLETYPPVEEQIVTFTFEEFASNTGYITYFASQGTDKNLLFQKSTYSNKITTTSGRLNSTPTSAAKQHDVDFDVPIPIGSEDDPGPIRRPSGITIVGRMI